MESPTDNPLYKFRNLSIDYLSLQSTRHASENVSSLNVYVHEKTLSSLSNALTWFLMT